jgi:hypothetical protein
MIEMYFVIGILAGVIGLMLFLVIMENLCTRNSPQGHFPEDIQKFSVGEEVYLRNYLGDVSKVVIEQYNGAKSYLVYSPIRELREVDERSLIRIIQEVKA